MSAAVDAATAAPFEVDVIYHGIPSSLEDAAEMSGVEPRQLQKTMVVRLGEGEYLIVLVPGDRVIDWKKLRHAVGESRLSLAPQDEAERATGFKRGTITPFGVRKPMPVVVDESMRGERISLGAGEPGTNLVLAADDLIEHFAAVVADIVKGA